MEHCCHVLNKVKFSKQISVTLLKKGISLTLNFKQVIAFSEYTKLILYNLFLELFALIASFNVTKCLKKIVMCNEGGTRPRLL
jgi:hypothetical protein